MHIKGLYYMLLDGRFHGKVLIWKYPDPLFTTLGCLQSYIPHFTFKLVFIFKLNTCPCHNMPKMNFCIFLKFEMNSEALW